MRINRKNSKKMADWPLVLINKLVNLISVQVAASVIVRRRAMLSEGSFGRLVSRRRLYSAFSF